MEEVSKPILGINTPAVKQALSEHRSGTQKTDQTEAFDALVLKYVSTELATRVKEANALPEVIPSSAIFLKISDRLAGQALDTSESSARRVRKTLLEMGVLVEAIPSEGDGVPTVFSIAPRFVSVRWSQAFSPAPLYGTQPVSFVSAFARLAAKARFDALIEPVAAEVFLREAAEEGKKVQEELTFYRALEAFRTQRRTLGETGMLTRSALPSFDESLQKATQTLRTFGTSPYGLSATPKAVDEQSVAQLVKTEQEVLSQLKDYRASYLPDWTRWKQTSWDPATDVLTELGFLVVEEEHAHEVEDSYA